MERPHAATTVVLMPRRTPVERSDKGSVAEALIVSLLVALMVWLFCSWVLSIRDDLRQELPGGTAWVIGGIAWAATFVHTLLVPERDDEDATQRSAWWLWGPPGWLAAGLIVAVWLLLT